MPARSLVSLGAKVIIAEIDKIAGAAAAEAISRESGPRKVLFVHTDVGDEKKLRIWQIIPHVLETSRYRSA